MLSLLTTTSSKGFGEQSQYVYQGSQSVAYHVPPSRAAQHIFNPPIGPGPPWPECYALLAHVCASPFHSAFMVHLTGFVAVRDAT
jgi:hypothetical protein